MQLLSLVIFHQFAMLLERDTRKFTDVAVLKLLFSRDGLFDTFHSALGDLLRDILLFVLINVPGDLIAGVRRLAKSLGFLEDLLDFASWQFL